jgi:hypothetical protein
MSSKPSAVPAEVCDFCHALLAEHHQHLIEPALRRLECVCDGCAILFSSEGQTKYRRIPRRVRFFPEFRLTDLQWNALMIPIAVAFLFRSSTEDRVVALYPSPGGPIESALPLDSWAQIVQDNPVLQAMEPDVEGLLVYRMGSARDHFLIPIDECFKLIGLIRTSWKGFSGGTVLWEQVATFLDRLKQ